MWNNGVNVYKRHTPYGNCTFSQINNYHVVPALYHDLVELLRQSRRGRETVAFVDYPYDLVKIYSNLIGEQIEQHK